jgi:hypothetical protein
MARIHDIFAKSDRSRKSPEQMIRLYEELRIERQLGTRAVYPGRAAFRRLRVSC